MCCYSMWCMIDLLMYAMFWAIHCWRDHRCRSICGIEVTKCKPKIQMRRRLIEIATLMMFYYSIWCMIHIMLLAVCRWRNNMLKYMQSWIYENPLKDLHAVSADETRPTSQLCAPKFHASEMLKYAIYSKIKWKYAALIACSVDFNFLVTMHQQRKPNMLAENPRHKSKHEDNDSDNNNL